MASFSECVIWARNTCQRPASSPIANLHACKEVHDTNVHPSFSMKHVFVAEPFVLLFCNRFLKLAAFSNDSERWPSPGHELLGSLQTF